MYGTYSFLDTHVQVVGPGMAVSLGSGAGVANEGITIEPREDKTSLLVGADGNWMTSLHAGTPAMITVRLLKTSPTNAILSAVYNFQSLSSENWGQNIFTIWQPNWQDKIVAAGCSFLRLPSVTYATEGNVNEWQFLCGNVQMQLGAGSQVSLNNFVAV